MMKNSDLESNLTDYQKKVLELLKQGWHIRTGHSFSTSYYFLELYRYDKDGKAHKLKDAHDAGLEKIDGITYNALRERMLIRIDSEHSHIAETIWMYDDGNIEKSKNNIEPKTSSMTVKVKDDTTIYSHESFGMIQIHNTTCGSGAKLFGSSLKHRHYITLSVTRATKRRHLSSDWYMPESRDLIEIDMSMTQFAEALTSLNTSGTPVTITEFNGEQIEECPDENTLETFRKEMEEKVSGDRQTIKQLIHDAERVLKRPGGITKAEKDALLSLLNSIANSLSNSMFTMKQFEEHVGNVLVEAKSEFNTHVSRIIEQKGIESIKKETLEIEGEKK